MPQYAVSLPAMLELTREPTGLPLLVLLQSIVTETVIFPIPGKDFAHQALLVRDDIPPQRWSAVVALIRKRYRYNQFPLYENPAGKRWKTIRSATLTEEEE
jgi:hypothetical protein